MDPHDEDHEGDAIAEVLLAHAVAALDDESATDPADAAPESTPDTGAHHQPDMGDPLTQPAPAPAPPAPTPPAPPTNPPAAPPPQPPGQDPAKGNGPDGYPENTPVADMTSEQQAAYWRKYARQHEERVKAMGDYDDLKATKERYDALVAASQTEQERAVAEARRQGHAEAMEQAGGRLVEAYVRAAAAGRLDETRVNALLEGVDRSRFLDQQTGEVDTGRVTAFVHALAPAPAAAAPAADPNPGQPVPAQQTPATPAPLTSGPDFGQGRQQGTRPHGIDAGRAIARERFTRNQAASGQSGPLTAPTP